MMTAHLHDKDVHHKDVHDKDVHHKDVHHKDVHDKNPHDANTSQVDERIANMAEAIALPRANGELVFAAPWEARAFGLAVALNEAGVYAWRDFSTGLAQEIATHETNPDEAAASSTTYYERWLATLEELVVANGLVTPSEIEAMMAVQALLDAHDHDHDHPHHDHHDDHDDHHHHQNGH